MNSKEFENKTILITGTSRGIGKALVKFFCDGGANVIGVSRTSCKIEHERFTELLYSIREVDEIEQILEQKGKEIDILVNNAGIICYKSLLEIERGEIESVFDTNFISTVLFTQMVAKRMIANQKKGIIINTLSFAAKIPSVGSGIYAASKAALESVTRTLAAELAPYGIRVNGYSPGVISTDMTEPVIEKGVESLVNNIALHGIGSCEQMVEIVAFLASCRSQYLCGCNIDASGGKFIVQNAVQAWNKE